MQHAFDPELMRVASRRAHALRDQAFAAALSRIARWLRLPPPGARTKAACHP